MTVFWRYRWFWLLVVVCTTFDLFSKAIVFDRLGVSDDDIHNAVSFANHLLETEQKELELEKQIRQRLAEEGKLRPEDQRPLSEPKLQITLDPPRRYTIIENRLYFTAVLNAGAFGGLLGGQILVLVVLSVVAVAVVAWVLLRSALPRYQVVSGLIIAGALGNIHDRLVFHCVRDFIDVWFPELKVSWLNPWNTFNFADSCIVVGIIGLLLLEFFFPVETEKKPSAAIPATPDAQNPAPPLASTP